MQSAYRLIPILVTASGLVAGCEPSIRGPVGADVDFLGDSPIVPGGCNRRFELAGYNWASSVWVSGSFTQPTPWATNTGDGALEMTEVDGKWVVNADLPPGRHLYKLVVDHYTWLSDPQNQEVEPDGLGGLNSVFECNLDKLCGDPEAFDWRDVVMYFVMIDRFDDSDDYADEVPGIDFCNAYFGSCGQYEGGDLPGVDRKLGYLADLGVTAIWLSAPYKNRELAGGALDSGSDGHTYSAYHGYWPSPADIDFGNPDSPTPQPLVEPRIGNETDLRAVIAAAHASQSKNGHGIKVLFDYVMNHADIESGLYQSHPDWFVEYRSCQLENLWSDPYWGTRCAFTSYLPAIDHYNETARAWSVADAVWWANDYGIDGYRLDAIKHVPLTWLTDLRRELNARVPDPPGGRFYLVGETFDYYDRELLKKYVHPETMLDGQFDFPYKRALCETAFNYSASMTDFFRFLSGNDRFYDPAAGPPALMTTWIGNHDIPRAIHFASRDIGSCTEGSHAGNSWDGSGLFNQPDGAEAYERLGVAFALMMTNPGIPLIYYGDEIGLAGGGDPDNRRMMKWDDLALNSHQLELRGRVARLAALRGQFPALGRGVRRNLAVTADTWLYERSCGDPASDVLVAVNRADGWRTVALPSGSYFDQIAQSPVTGGEYNLPPHGFLVLTAP